MVATSSVRAPVQPHILQVLRNTGLKEEIRFSPLCDTGHLLGSRQETHVGLPPLRSQFMKSDHRFLNAGKQCIIRLMTPLRMRYEEAYIKAYPFNKMINGMMSPQMIEETVGIVLAAIDEGVRINVIINNRAGGNAPIIAQKISEGFLEVHSRRKRT